MEITVEDVTLAITTVMGELSHMGADDAFTDLDVDSLTLVEAAVILTQKFGVHVDEFELAEAGSAREAARLLTAKQDLQPAH
jgi:acyl carrier protein